jgi:hypothetical protein
MCLMAKRITQKEKIAKYEELLHKIQLHAQVTCNENAVRQLIGNICNWSYSHRSGELTSTEQQTRIDAAFNKLTEIKHETK